MKGKKNHGSDARDRGLPLEGSMTSNEFKVHCAILESCVFTVLSATIIKSLMEGICSGRMVLIFPVQVQKLIKSVPLGSEAEEPTPY